MPTSGGQDKGLRLQEACMYATLNPRPRHIPTAALGLAFNPGEPTHLSDAHIGAFAL